MQPLLSNTNSQKGFCPNCCPLYKLLEITLGFHVCVGEGATALDYYSGASCEEVDVVVNNLLGLVGG